MNNVIEQIAFGENTVNGIATKTGEKEPTILYSLEKLISVGLVEKRRCITEEKNKKKTQYVLKDHMFKFWYEFIPKAHSVIEMCRYFTFEQGIMGRFDSFITQTGAWWGVETIENQAGVKYAQSADIDVVAISDIDKTALVGECKFKNEKIDKGIYETLLRRSGIIAGKYHVKKLLFFSLSGYTEWFEKLKNDAVVLFALEDMYQ